MKVIYDSRRDVLTVKLSESSAEKTIQTGRVSIGYRGKAPVSVSIAGGLDFVKSAVRALLAGEAAVDIRDFTVKMPSFTRFLRTAAEKDISAVSIGSSARGRFVLFLWHGKPVGGLYELSGGGKLRGELAVLRILRDVRRERGVVRVITCSPALIQEIASLQGEL
ncbi:MAG: hypothetical protein DRN99_08890, partial [Thermoproteota archaeon]